MRSNDVFKAFLHCGLFEEVDHNEFSKIPCEACDSKLGGERWKIEGFVNRKEVKPENLHELWVCRDCYDKLYEVDYEVSD